MHFSTQELLTITGVSSPTFNQWVNRHHLTLTSGEQHGSGNHRRHETRDVMQVAVIAELTGLGVPPGRAKLVWLWAIAPAIIVPGAVPPTVLVAQRPDGSDVDVRVVHGGDFGLDAPDAPASFIVLRMDALARRIIKRIEQVKGPVS